MSRTSTSRPVRIRLVGDVPLAEHGLASMLGHYGEVVRVLTSDEPDVAPDLTLHDPFQSCGPTTRGGVPALGRVSPWVVWSWDRQRHISASRDLPAPVGYLFKGARAPRLVAELLRIAGGELVISREERAAPSESWAGQRHGLTWRQSDVLVALARGCTNAEIAQEFALSPNTVKSYIRLAYQTIGVTNRSGAILWASAHGLRPAADVGAAYEEAKGLRTGSSMSCLP
jgi:DNA-binding CsgD family transcriptional regulator